MISLDLVTEFVNEHFSNVSTSRNGTHFVARCVLCGDSKKNPRKRRFNLDYKSGYPVYRCWNCNKSGSFLTLYAELNNLDIDEAKKEIFKYDPNLIRRRLSRKKNVREKRKPIIENHDYIKDYCLTLESKCKSFQDRKYVEYLQKFIEKRKIPKKYKICVSNRGDYKGRFIIPIFDKNGSIIFFQGRSIFDDMIPKYMNPDIEKVDIIWNENKFDKNKPIIIVEGIIDAMMFLDQGTTSMGTSINDDFIKRILSCTNERVIIIFDNDKAGIKSLSRFISGPNASIHSRRLNYFLFPKKFNNCKDINNIVVDYGIKNIYDLVVKNSCSYSTTYTRLYANKLLN